VQELGVLPAPARDGDVRALLVGVYRFLTFSRGGQQADERTQRGSRRQGALQLGQCRVEPGRDQRGRVSSSLDSARLRNFRCFRGAIDPVSRRRGTSRKTQASLTSNRVRDRRRRHPAIACVSDSDDTARRCTRIAASRRPVPAVSIDVPSGSQLRYRISTDSASSVSSGGGNRRNDRHTLAGAETRRSRCNTTARGLHLPGRPGRVLL
jgi:hypothetical protein